jgi:hypothetical protein
MSTYLQPEPCLELEDFGDAVQETRQISGPPVHSDNAFQFGWV